MFSTSSIEKMSKKCSEHYVFFTLQCLLNNEEIEIKTKLWMEENRDYLEKLKGQ